MKRVHAWPSFKTRKPSKQRFLYNIKRIRNKKSMYRGMVKKFFNFLQNDVL